MKNFTSFLKEAGGVPEQPNRISDDLDYYIWAPQPSPSRTWENF